MRTAWISIAALIVASFATLTHAQALPDAPIPHILRSAPLPAKIMFFADSALRVGDVITTYKILNDPCRCFREADPIAPKGGALLPSIAFQASAGAAVFLGSQLLRHYHHRKLAYMLQAIDIESETYAVFANNIPLMERPRAATIATPAPTPSQIGFSPLPHRK